MQVDVINATATYFRNSLCKVKQVWSLEMRYLFCIELKIFTPAVTTPS